MPNLTNKVFKGSAWVFGVRFAQKMLAAFRAIILARLLTPEDFGLFGVALLILAAFEVLTRTGFNDAIIHKRGNIESYLHTSYWIQVLRGFVLGGLVFVSAPFVARFFSDPTVVPIVRALALVQIFRGFQSLGIILLQRDLDFRRESFFLFVGTSVEFVSTIVLAWVFRNTWALVIGAIVGETTRTIMSFIVHPYRPQLFFSLEKSKELVRFGIWLFAAGLVSYIALQADNIFVGRWLGVESLGVYQMAFLLANLPTSEITKLFGRVFKPAYAELQYSTDRLSSAFAKTFSVTITLVLPSSVGLMIIAPVLVPTLLGQKWWGVIPLLPVLALGGLFRGVGGIGSSLLVATGNTRFVFWTELSRALILLSCLYPSFILGNATGVAWAVVVSTFVMLLVMMWAVHKITTNLNLLLKQIMPAIAATILMTGGLLSAVSLLSPGWGELILLISIGGVIYIPAILILERMLGTSVFDPIRKQFERIDL